MVITPARFEDEMRKLDANLDVVGAIELMKATLRSLGYEAGVRIFEEGVQNENRTD